MSECSNFRNVAVNSEFILHFRKRMTHIDRRQVLKWALWQYIYIYVFNHLRDILVFGLKEIEGHNRTR